MLGALLRQISRVLHRPRVIDLLRSCLHRDHEVGGELEKNFRLGINRMASPSGQKWLLSESPLDADGVPSRLKVEQERLKRAAEQNWHRFCQVRDEGEGEATVAVMDRLLRETGTLRALGKARFAT